MCLLDTSICLIVQCLMCLLSNKLFIKTQNVTHETRYIQVRVTCFGHAQICTIHVMYFVNTLTMWMWFANSVCIARGKKILMYIYFL